MEKTEKLEACARALGQEIAGHPRLAAFAAAQEKLNQDEAARKLVDSLTAQIRKIAELERDMKPIGPEDKREFARLQEEAAQNPILQEFMRAQADYVEMMKRVDDAIRAELGAAGDEDVSGESPVVGG